MTITTFTKEHLERLRRSSFPKLRFGDDRVTSDETDYTDPVPYNCIALAANDKTRWWQYDPKGEAGFKTYWPDSVEVIGEVTLATWVKIFEKELGYKRTKKATYEPGFEKVAIYANKSEPTHVARQVGKRRWLSKLGSGHDIEHATLASLAGHSHHEYGEVVRILKRKRK
jgi:hypothetical protein